MKYYLIKLKPKDFFSKIPSSYTLFGAFCWAIKDLYNLDIKDYIKKFSKNPDFFISDVFLYDEINEEYLLPKPLSMNIDVKKHMEKFEDKSIKKIFEEEFQNSYDKDLYEKSFKLFLVNKFKKFKKIKYINSKDFFDFINGEKTKIDIFKEYIKKEKEKNFDRNKPKLVNFPIQRNNIDRLTMSVNEESGGTFYENVISLKGYDLYFILKTKKIEWLLPILKFSFEKGIGKKKSIGRGQFNLEIIEDNNAREFLKNIEGNVKKDSEYKITLSKYIPLKNEFDVGNSYYQIEGFRGITEDREYFSGKNIFKAKVSYIKEGSVLKVKEQKEFYGDIPIVKYIDDKEIYHYGYGFFLNFKKVKK
ncbi:type III-A CRISPR-associated RAMP protein Csm4 [Marinitoga sp. 1155]|uniref:type III-A CRISPR-associated RAMP protein Csm4 n=1 Tax=Marinitoga sp. 1155 TaxID=1428448 RepID=UPI0012E05D98|nr:hypothetical protein [Marinitoga sp. 1155]